MRDINLTLSTSEINNVGQIVIRQDDKNTQKLIATITENGQAKNLVGLTPYFNAMIKGHVIARDIAEITGKSEVSYILKEGFYQKTGRIEGFFSFESNGNRESTANFNYHVIKGTCRNIAQGNYIYTFEELAKTLGDIIDNDSVLPLIVKVDELNAKLDGYQIETLQDIENLKKDIDLSFVDFKNQTNESIKKHEDNKANPHNVTANQTGAFTKQEVRDLLSGTKIVTLNGTYLVETDKYEYDYSKLTFGIILVWGSYIEGEGAKNSHFQTQLIAKETINSYPGSSHSFFVGPNVANQGVKIVYVNKNELFGHENNAKAGNTVAVLRKIIFV